MRWDFSLWRRAAVNPTLLSSIAIEHPSGVGIDEYGNGYVLGASYNIPFDSAQDFNFENESGPITMRNKSWLEFDEDGNITVKDTEYKEATYQTPLTSGHNINDTGTFRLNTPSTLDCDNVFYLYGLSELYIKGTPDTLVADSFIEGAALECTVEE